MDPGDQTVTLDEFLMWKVEALGDFLTKRGMTKDGSKHELAALCFAAHSMNLPIVPSSSEVLLKNAYDYRKLLFIDGDVILDPLLIYDNWLNEKSGMRHWPPIYISDIIKYMVDNDTKAEVEGRLNEYKIGKAYEYFNAGFLKEVFYHAVPGRSNICILKADCTPSLKVKDDPHQVWVVSESVTGAIKSAYCTCTAGLGSTCNHIAGLLFRVESANKLGLVACTSLPCTWNIPVPKNLKPSNGNARLADVEIKKSRHGKIAKRPLVFQSKKTYQPHGDIDKKEMLNELSSALKDVLPNACLFKGVECDKGESVFGDKSENVQLTPKQQTGSAEDLSRYSMAYILQESQDLDKLPTYTQDEVIHISELTVGQWTNNSWHDMRKDRITSSKFYSVYTKVNTLLRKEDVSCRALISNVLGYSTPHPDLKSLKHGRETEPEAKEVYKRVMSVSEHRNVSVSECGFFIHHSVPYLGSSPDLLVSCSCCGEGVVEIKCPLIGKCQTCTSFCTCKLPACLHSVNNTIVLKHNHAYYAQVQGQLATTNRSFCDFFVYTCNGYFMQRVSVDKLYFSKVLQNLKYFFEKFVLPEVVSRSIQRNEQGCDGKLQNETQLSPKPMDFETTYFCPVCRNVVKEAENVKQFSDQSISCDVCNLWYHFKCVKITKCKASKIQNWICAKCSVTDVKQC